MKSKRYNISGILTVVLIILILILASICAFVILTGDSKAPTIMIDEEYLKKCDLNDENDILKAVSAVDDKTEKVEVFLLNIIDYEDGTYKVSFSARDDSGNTASKGVVIENPNGLIKEFETNQEMEIDLEQAAENSTEDNTEEVSQEAETMVSGSPIIKLLTDETEITNRNDFLYLSYIDSIEDDKDTQEELYHRINIKVELDPNNSDRYIVKYYVKDTDGNRSNTEMLVVNVRQ